MTFDALLFAAALVSTEAPACPAASPAPVVAAERAFAADAPGLGVGGSFNKWALPDAVVIAQGRAQTVREVYPPEAARPADEPRLEWWPNWAGIARSGDLGFTTGGVAVNGRAPGTTSPFGPASPMANGAGSMTAVLGRRRPRSAVPTASRT